LAGIAEKGGLLLRAQEPDQGIDLINLHFAGTLSGQISSQKFRTEFRPETTVTNLSDNDLQ
jgi:hypothetical protein